jgi:hypothetical protein
VTDLASLGLEVDSASLEKGTEKLKDFSASAKEAAKSADDFNAKQRCMESAGWRNTRPGNKSGWVCCNEYAVYWTMVCICRS